MVTREGVEGVEGAKVRDGEGLKLRGLGWEREGVEGARVGEGKGEVEWMELGFRGS